MKILNLTEYLNEKNLGDILKFIFKDCEIIPQYRVKTINKTMIIDYMVQTKFGMLFVEFNGHFHYQKSITQFRDMLLVQYCEINNIQLASIPYFIQLDTGSAPLFFTKEIIDEYFINIEICTNFPHGFISEKLILPCDFNIAGWNSFSYDTMMCMQKDRDSIAKAIYESLQNKLNTSKFKLNQLTIGVDMKCYPERLTPTTYFKHYPS